MSIEVSKRGIILFLFSTLVLTSITQINSVFSRFSNEVYTYSFHDNGNLGSELISYFDKKSNLQIAHYDLNEGNFSIEFLKIVGLLVESGVNVVPPELCTPCVLSHYTWEEIYLMYASPLVVFFCNGSLVAISIGTSNIEVFDQVLLEVNNGLKLFVRNDEVLTLSEEQLRIQLENVITRQEGESSYYDFWKVLPLIVTSAAIDAVNPCEFYVLIILLSMVFFRIGRKKVLMAGISYSLAVFIIYYLMGFGLWNLFVYVQEVRLLIVIIGFSIGLRAVLNFIFGVFGLSLGFRDVIGSFLNRKVKRVPVFFSRKLSGLLKRTSENPLTSFAIGIVSSVFLLPCTSGPYLIALSFIAKIETFFEGLLLLAVYNSIIIAPFLVITLCIYTLKLKTKELKKWSSEKLRWFNFAAGLLMIVLSVYLVLTIIW